MTRSGRATLFACLVVAAAGVLQPSYAFRVDVPSGVHGAAATRLTSRAVSPNDLSKLPRSRLGTTHRGSHSKCRTAGLASHGFAAAPRGETSTRTTWPRAGRSVTAVRSIGPRAPPAARFTD